MRLSGKSLLIMIYTGVNYPTDKRMQTTVRSEKREKEGETEVVFAVKLLVSWKGKNRRYWRMGS